MGPWVSRYRLRHMRFKWEKEERRNGINLGAKHEIVRYDGLLGAESASFT